MYCPSLSYMRPESGLDCLIGPPSPLGPLIGTPQPPHGEVSAYGGSIQNRQDLTLQGYLAHKKPPPPDPYSTPMPGALWWF